MTGETAIAEQYTPRQLRAPKRGAISAGEQTSSLTCGTSAALSAEAANVI